ncbi:MAG: protein phosphatase 2C domain-containing protein [Acidobacteriota bacterium]|nr:protein phosphatase 2C domain-containing protein [Acidobacteriota bacterium]
MRLLMSGLTDIGRKRDLNEDSLLWEGIPAPAVESGLAYLLAVADGIGGHSSGEVASATAIAAVRDAVSERLGAAGPVPGPAGLLEEAFGKANEAVFQLATARDHMNGMGTTLVAVLVAGEKAAAANVGDSRLYLVREEVLSQITVDHSWAADQLRLRLMTEADVNRSPFRNVVTRSIGGAEPPAIDTFEIDIRTGDRLLLASDGLFGPLEDKDILKPFRRKRKPEGICRALIRAACKAGGRDNITAVVAWAVADSRGRGRRFLPVF